MKVTVLMLCLALAAGAAAFCGQRRPAGSIAYTVIEPNIPGIGRSRSSRAAGLNEFDEAVSFAWNPGSAYATRAYLWSDGKATDLGNLPGMQWAEPSGINDAGQIVGWSYGNPGRICRAFLWWQSRMRDLGTLGGKESRAWGLNDAGLVVGQADTGAPRKEHLPAPYHAFLWQNGKLRDLGAPLGDYSEARAVNNRGQIAGSSYNLVLFTRGISSGNELHGQALLWDKDRARYLGTLGGKSSRAFGLNDRGQVIGYAELPADDKNQAAPHHAFLWENGRMRDLGTLGGRNSEALAINDKGQVVGWSEIRADSSEPWPRRAFLWDRERGMRDLNLLLAVPKSWSLLEAKDINNAGQIAANGLPGSKVGWETIRGLLLTPHDAAR